MEKDCSDDTCRSGRTAPDEDRRDAPEPDGCSRERAAQCRVVHGGCPVKVLIVEDDMIIATDLAAMIEEHGGIVVATTSDPARAVRLGLELYPDTVLMDVVLPGQTDGVDTAHLIRDLVGSAIVFCTASTDPETLRRMQAVDGSAIVQKPILSMELCQAIRRVTRKEKRP